VHDGDRMQKPKTRGDSLPSTSSHYFINPTINRTNAVSQIAACVIVSADMCMNAAFGIIRLKKCKSCKTAGLFVQYIYAKTFGPILEATRDQGPVLVDYSNLYIYEEFV
jgi:hypothetical protein